MTTATKKGPVGRFFNRMIETRQVEARGAVDAFLFQLDDATLTKLGYDRKKLKPNYSGNMFL